MLEKALRKREGKEKNERLKGMKIKEEEEEDDDDEEEKQTNMKGRERTKTLQSWRKMALLGLLTPKQKQKQEKNI